MKLRSVILFVMAAVMTAVMTASAQQLPRLAKAYLFHFSDGGKQVFYTDMVEAMRISTLDVDGNETGHPATQEIVMDGNAYRFPLESIDSIKFTTPPVEFQPGVVVMENTGLAGYVTACDYDNMVLTLSTDIPDKLLPSPGTLVACMEQNDIFDIGFIGEVTAVERGDDDVTLSCKRTSMTKIFKTYYAVCEDTYVESEEEGSPASRSRKIYDDQNFHNAESHWNPDPISINLIDWTHLSTDPPQYFVWDRDAEYKTLFNPVKMDLSIRPDIRIRSTLVIEKGGYYFNMTGKGTVTRDFNWSLKGKVSGEREKELFKLPLSPNRLYRPYIQLKGVVRPEIEAGMEARYHKVYNLAFACSYGTGEVKSPLKDVFSFKENKDRSLAGSSGNYVKGGVDVGLILQLGFEFLDDEFISARLAGEAGLHGEFKMEVPYGSGPAPDQDPDRWQYQYLHESFARVLPYLKVGFEIETAKKKFTLAEFEHSFGEDNEPLRYVPSFSGLKVNRSSAKPSMAVCEATVEGILIRDWEVGFAVFDDKHTRVASVFSPVKYSGWPGAEHELRLTLSDLPVYKDLKVYTALMSGDDVLLVGEPVKLRKAMEPESIPAMNVEQKKADVVGVISGYDTDGLKGVDVTHRLKVRKTSSQEGARYVDCETSLNDQTLTMHNSLDNLEPGTDYTYAFETRVTEHNDGEDTVYDINTDEQSFTTLPDIPVRVEADCDGHFSAELDASEVDAIKGEYLAEVICAEGVFSSSKIIGESSSCTSEPLASKIFKDGKYYYRADIRNLKPETTYSYALRAYLGIDENTSEPIYAYSQAKTFTTGATDLDEKASLEHLFDIANGENWQCQNTTAPWKSDRGLCNWSGYDPHQGLLSLDMNFDGPLMLSNMKHLKSLRLTYGEITGSIPYVKLTGCSAVQTDDYHKYGGNDDPFYINLPLPSLNVTLDGCCYDEITQSISIPVSTLDLNVSNNPKNLTQYVAFCEEDVKEFTAAFNFDGTSWANESQIYVHSGITLHLKSNSGIRVYNSPATGSTPAAEATDVVIEGAVLESSTLHLGVKGASVTDSNLFQLSVATSEATVTDSRIQYLTLQEGDHRCTVKGMPSDDDAFFAVRQATVLGGTVLECVDTSVFSIKGADTSDGVSEGSVIIVNSTIGGKLVENFSGTITELNALLQTL